MKKTTKDTKKAAVQESQQPQANPSPEFPESFGNNKSAKSLGGKRWEYQGKIYKEQD